VVSLLEHDERSASANFGLIGRSSPIVGRWAENDPVDFETDRPPRVAPFGVTPRIPTNFDGARPKRFELLTRRLVVWCAALRSVRVDQFHAQTPLN